jgi:predicted tellurium resistance membrane protein TerC
MFELLVDPHAWVSFATLAVLEIVLGIDNIIFLSIITGKLPIARQPAARRVGLALALLMRIALLASIVWITKLTTPIFTLYEHEVSWRDLIMLSGGMFLLFKGTTEVHHMVDSDEEEESDVKAQGFLSVIIQIAVLDLVFSLDSVITAVGMAEHLPIMIAAVVFAIGVMLVASEPVSNFVNNNPSIKMLALSFILLVGMALVADGMHVHIPKGYLYFAIAFSLSVETLNLLAAKRRSRRALARKARSHS